MIRRRFQIARIVVSIMIVISHVPSIVSMLNHDVTDNDQGPLDIFSIVVQSAVVLTIMTSMTWGLCKFVLIVQEFSDKQEVSLCLIIVQIFCIVLLSLTVIAIGIAVAVDKDSPFDYKKILSLTIIDMVVINTNSINFGIIGLILYNSSQAAV